MVAKNKALRNDQQGKHQTKHGWLQWWNELNGQFLKRARCTFGLVFWPPQSMIGKVESGFIDTSNENYLHWRKNVDTSASINLIIAIGTSDLGVECFCQSNHPNKPRTRYVGWISSKLQTEVRLLSRNGRVKQSDFCSYIYSRTGLVWLVFFMGLVWFGKSLVVWWWLTEHSQLL